MTEPMVAFHGSTSEAGELVAAIARNCQCIVDQATERRVGDLCPAHLMLGSQRVLDGLLLMRHLAPKLWAEETAECP